MKGIGYYYEGFDAEAGAKALLQATTAHDERQADYAKQCDDYLYTKLVDNPVNVDAHVSRLVRILNEKRRKKATK
jgi:hypothetical protein